MERNSSSDQNLTNARFFDSNTLYRKELKQKQREIISPTTSSAPTSIATTSLSFANAISTTITNGALSSSNKNASVNVCGENGQMNFDQNIYDSRTLLKEEESEDRDERFLNKEEILPSPSQSPSQSPSLQSKPLQSQPAVSTSNKMLNLFSSFLNRHSHNSKTLFNHQNLSFSNSSNTAMNNNNNNNNGNYLNIKNLKRATSTNNFGGGSKIKVHSNEAPTSANKAFFNPVALFSSSSNNNNNKNKVSEILQSNNENLAPSSMKTSNNKHRRSYDDVSKLSIQVTDSNTFEQSQISTKSNVLVVSPRDAISTTSKLFGNKNNNAASKHGNNLNFESTLIKDLNSSETENIFIDLSSNSKFENTAFSTKNNGLIFLPSPTKNQSSIEIITEKQNTSQNDSYETVRIDSVKKGYDCLQNGALLEGLLKYFQLYFINLRS
jgi:hypothetical protein